MKNSIFRTSTRCLILVLSFLLLTAFHVNADQTEAENIDLGNWTESKLDELMQQKSKKPGTQDQIDFLSEQFLGTPYKGHTLTGDIDTPEVFTINLGGMDCFTYIDYVEALRVSGSYPDFKDSLQNIRYRGGDISFLNRNHFFTDWPVNNPQHVKDVTREIGGDKTVSVKKRLNIKKDGGKYLPGIPANEREVYYIPSASIDEDIVGELNTGDYVGIYTELPGLDVTHTGIVIKRNGRAYLRHASSRSVNDRVVDEDLLEYMQNKPGLVVFRPLSR